MPVRLRLRRTGSKNKACFRVVAADSRSPRDGRFIEVIGLYDPRHENENLNLERVDYWLKNGAQPSETVAAIIKRVRSKPPQSEVTAATAEGGESKDTSANVEEMKSDEATVEAEAGKIADDQENSETAPASEPVAQQQENVATAADSSDTAEIADSDVPDSENPAPEKKND